MLLAGCDSSQPAPPPTPDPGPTPPPGAERITGSERLGWNQQAATGEELATFRYLIYVDSSAADAQDVACSPTAGPAGFACTARMPLMSAGSHALTLSSYIESGGSRFESPRSPAVSVFLVAQTVTSAAGSGAASADGPGTITLRDGIRLSSEVVVEGLDTPGDLAVVDDGSILVAERDGRILIVRGRRLSPIPAVSLTDIDVARGGLLSLAFDRRDGRRVVFALYTTTRGFRLARFTLVAGTLGDRAILLDEIPSSGERASGFVRIGPDHRLYVGLDDAGDARRSGDRGSFSGKVLRLNVDGTTPADQRSGSPIFVTGMTAPRGAAWLANGKAWVLDVSGETSTVGPIDDADTAARRYRLPERSEPSAIAVYGLERPSAFRDNIFVAAPGAGSILRLVPDPADSGRIASTERLQDKSLADVTAMVVGRDGSLYASTGHSLLRLTPR
jgi:glucose/arabinose dehydrogenase